MRLLFVRHGDPDYENDCLTPRGIRQAEKLKETFSQMDIAAVYVSPLGRARQTAKIALGRDNFTVLPFLSEFEGVVPTPDGRQKNFWEFLWEFAPQISDDPLFYHPTRWQELACFRGTNVPKKYAAVLAAFDGLLARHGIEKQGTGYVDKGQREETVAVFSHFGISSIFLAHLLGVSPLPQIYSFYALPSSITAVDNEPCGACVRFLSHTYGSLEHTRGIEKGIST